MPNLKPKDIKDEVRIVLEGTHIDTGGRGRSFLTAYQILERLPPLLRSQLLEERGIPGSGAGRYYAAASVVSDAAEMLKPNIEIRFLDKSSIKIILENGTDIEPGNPNVGLYRLVNQ